VDPSDGVVHAVPAQVDAVVVGAGTVGLAAGLLLARQGLTVLIAERRSRMSVHPRATGINVRTMEIFRSLGLERDVMDASLPADGVPFLLLGESLVGPVRATVESTQYQSTTPPDWPSPTRAVWCAQDQLDPILTAAVTAEPTATLRMSAEVVDFRVGGDAVVVEVNNTETGRVDLVTAEYLVAADGPRSAVRRRLGIGVTGEPNVSDELSILFRADLAPLLGERRFLLYRVDNDRIRGVVRPAGASDRWFLGVPGTQDTSVENCADLVRAAVGVADLDVEVLAAGAWHAAAVVADSFGGDRVFLCGDAAHQHTPGGGFGLNVGIQGAHNLAWKLAGVVRGWAGPGLLDTYERERRPVAQLTAELSIEALRAGGARSAKTLGVVLGADYNSSAVLADGTPPTAVADPVADYEPSARPGQRAPHVWLDRGGDLSTLDLFGRGFVLLTGTARAWEPAVAAAAGVPVRIEERPPGAWAAAYGVRPDGGVLVRPDGYIAARWPVRPDDPQQVFGPALHTLTH
jgi:putative polyketide hydroxylase